MQIPTTAQQVKYAVFLDASGTLLQSSVSNAIGVQLYLDTKNILQAFKDRKINQISVATGVITNWGNRINGMLRALQVDSYFDVIISSDTVQKTKPDPSIYHYACTCLKVDPRHAIHIGDSLLDDALGAQNAGLHGIWLKRGNYLPEEAKNLIHPYFSNLNDIFQYIQKKIIIS
ncbi:HAD-IA family hydrolase [Pigmentibacter sp. JX0631]|uniref:HAD family hydrolase n=1 Tax=Pigmentibacter sp. JX0631 TaxID=2976982 RepID=UPI002468B618|nr:HAD-IA family hydrolase [Pigmentibacter sp. JX0631]WGL59001.1 HAD-IA family hydrolase [Pigmentibacter sp. JX0631]